MLGMGAADVLLHGAVSFFLRAVVLATGFASSR